ncbi:MAG: hypothetical protein ACO3DS_08980, partial [Phycisphaerales bacterium]
AMAWSRIQARSAAGADGVLGAVGAAAGGTAGTAGAGWAAAFGVDEEVESAWGVGLSHAVSASATDASAASGQFMFVVRGMVSA